ncbi:uncharacterized protein LOC135368390 [Ornithodoros turicata]
MRVHSKASNVKLPKELMRFRKLHKLKLKAKKANKPPRAGGVRPGDEDLIHQHTVRRRRGTNPMAPISLSGKKRNKELKRLRHHQKDTFEKRKLQETLERSRAEGRMKAREKAERRKARRAAKLQALNTSTADVEMQPADGAGNNE